MTQFKIIDHSKNQIYKQFEDALYGYAEVPKGYELLFERNNWKSGFNGKVYIKGNHIVVATEGTKISNPIDDSNDYVLMTRKHVPAQFYDYLEIYKTIKDLKVIYPNIKTTWLGYSLTCNPAQTLAVLSGEETICFAPIGAGNTMKHLDKIYNSSLELQKLFPNYHGLENADTSNITNYYCEGDFFVELNKNAQIGDVYVVPVINNEMPHKLYNWTDLTNAMLDKTFDYNDLIYSDYIWDSDIRLYGQVEKYADRHRKKVNKNTPTGYAADVNDIDNSSQRDIESEYYNKTGKHYPIIMPSSNELYGDKCSGSYPVSGYTRSDGTKVSGYIRNCYKHRG